MSWTMLYASWTTSDRMPRLSASPSKLCLNILCITGSSENRRAKAFKNGKAVVHDFGRDNSNSPVPLTLPVASFKHARGATTAVSASPPGRHGSRPAVRGIGVVATPAA
mmetsp:Transcript_30384/g.87036  ORF Transcript_30384/g.87036 Transcript_30384/m.87036 type:complete len:109 (+) Transcript_30384:886-1212(+)